MGTRTIDSLGGGGGLLHVLLHAVLLGLDHSHVLRRDGGVLGNDSPHLVTTDGLLLHQQLSKLIDGLAVVDDVGLRRLIRPVHNLLHVAVDGLLQVLGHLILGHHPHDHVLALCALRRQTPGTNVREPEGGYHLLGNVSHLLQVPTGSTGGLGIAIDDLLRSTAPQGPDQAGKELLLADEGRVLPGDEPGQPLGLSAGDQRHLLDRVVAGLQGPADGVAHLVVPDKGLDRAVGHGLALQPGDDAVDAVVHLLEADDGLVAAAREDGGLVHQVGEVRPREAGGPQGNDVQGDLRGQLLVPGVHLQDAHAASLVRHVHLDLAIETAWAEQGGVQNVGPVSGPQDDDTRITLEAVHLREELIQGLLTLIVPLAHASTTGPADGVDLIHEDQAGAVLLCFLEQVTDTRGTHTNEHLNELRPRDGEERHSGLTSHGLRQQSLPGTRRPNQEDTLRNLGTNCSEALRAAEEFNNFLEVLLGLVYTSHLVKGYSGFGDHLEAGLGLAQIERAVGAHTHAAVGASENEDDPCKGEQGPSQDRQHLPNARGILVNNIHLDALGLKLLIDGGIPHHGGGGGPPIDSFHS
mmetsp:Transcript_2754/g.4944  ORF Transcript_2754/g.4944 Transcript_2754/m.4944 type:complete len:579 (+) Transcript_2754:492-2228(+)